MNARQAAQKKSGAGSGKHISRVSNSNLIPLVEKQHGDFRSFSEDTPGIKVQPWMVFVISLVYMAIVVFLHIFSKITGAITAPAAGKADL